MSIKKIILPSFILLCSYMQQSSAGGPLSSTNSTPITYSNPNIVLHIETGDLGVIANDDADLLVQQAFSIWSNVTTSTINLTQGTDINLDIDSNNFNAFFSGFDNNFIVYDADGSIIDSFFPQNNNNDFVVGFSSAITNGKNLIQGYAVINGTSINNFTETNFILTITHEIGHLFGLDHSQTDINNTETTDIALSSNTGQPRICQSVGRSPDDYALMYPFICRESKTLHPDDISAISGLYPTTDTTQHFGIISGSFVDTNGNPILGANIWAENSTGAVISTISDYLEKGDGSYQLLLPEGNYSLHANSINPGFFGGSGIGPYASTSTSISFQAPHPITEVIYQGNNLGNAAIITVNNGSTTNIVFGIDGNTGTVATAAAQSSGGGGGGGTLSPLSALFLALSLLIVRRKG